MAAVDVIQEVPETASIQLLHCRYLYFMQVLLLQQQVYMNQSIFELVFEKCFHEFLKNNLKTFPKNKLKDKLFHIGT